MTYPTPSQAEGEPEEPDPRDTSDGPAPERSTPSQAEGERDDERDDAADDAAVPEAPPSSPQEREP
ncbi:hypothetical protein DI272_43635 [Streptomyces sp. Act143]|uniref:hypothetical protein n=1 Tax=Streptomyces sp. Act143 TaxID=2200760 RepID=UPI000D681FAC|nr:hypothetical protein [Streptomyces sp. Act143]PWI12683.1 hypothetical protein DI272_43635 [Streptomyces sp. Act143]